MRPDLQSVATAFVETLLTNAEARNAYEAAVRAGDDVAAASVVDRVLSPPPTPPIAAADMPDLIPLVAAGLAAKGAAQQEVATTETPAPGDVGGRGANVQKDKGTPGPNDAEGGGSSLDGDEDPVG